MTRLTQFVLRHRRWVLLFWLVLAVGGGFASGSFGERVSYDYALPGQPGYETSLQITDAYGNGGQVAPLIAVVAVPGGSQDDTVAAAAGVFGALAEAIPDIRVVDYANTGNDVFLTADGSAT